MFGWLYRILVGSFHIHKWKIIQTSTVYARHSDEDLPRGNCYTLQCEKCGNIKYKKNYSTW